MSIFNFNMAEILTFFMVMIRYSILFSILPFVGDRVIPPTIKILMGLIISISLFPALIKTGQVQTEQANIWGRSAGGIIQMGTIESVLALAIGFSARLIFDGISMGANLVGNFMGFSAATIFDPHRESQTEIVGRLQTSLAMLLFLAIDGHHLMLKAALDSYKIVGMGKAEFSPAFAHRLVQMIGEVFAFGMKLAAPVCISLFSVNTVFGIVSRTMPQLNILVLSFTMSALVGFTVLCVSSPESQGVIGGVLVGIGNWMNKFTLTFASGS